MPMRVAVCGRHLDDLYPLLEPHAPELTEDNPELVISYGGDGALLGAERQYPGIPKCPIRDRRSNPKCPRHSEEQILEKLFGGELAETGLTKVEAEKDGRTVVGLNDIVVSRRMIASALRYRIWLDDELYAHQIVGDGLVVATPFGSTAYYRSITRSLFRWGLGLAFNNSTEPIDHLVLHESSTIAVEILRGPAVLLADNDPEDIPLENGGVVTITKSRSSAVVLGLDVFRCPECYWLRHHEGSPG